MLKWFRFKTSSPLRVFVNVILIYVIVFLCLCSAKQAWTLSIFFANRHHAEVAVNIKDENWKPCEWFVVQVTSDNFDDEVDGKEEEVKSLGVDPVGQVLNFVLEQRKMMKFWRILRNCWTYGLKNLKKSVGHDDVQHVDHKSNRKEQSKH